MATKGSPAGMGVLYGVVIGDLLGKETVSVDDLQDLRKQVQQVVDVQGDLHQALTLLDNAIARKGGGAESVRVGVSRPVNRYWHVGYGGVQLSDADADRIAGRLKQ